MVQNEHERVTKYGTTEENQSLKLSKALDMVIRKHKSYIKLRNQHETTI